MGGESIKPIRKRIHVYFLMTAYRVHACSDLAACYVRNQNNKKAAEAYASTTKCMKRFSGITFGMAVVLAICDFAALTFCTSQHAL